MKTSTDPSIEVRGSAAWAIGWTSNRLFNQSESDEAARKLLQLTQDENRKVREKALIGWGWFRGDLSDDLTKEIHKTIIDLGENDNLISINWIANAVRNLKIKPSPKLADSIQRYNDEETKREKEIQQYDEKRKEKELANENRDLLLEILSRLDNKS